MKNIHIRLFFAVILLCGGLGSLERIEMLPAVSDAIDGTKLSDERSAFKESTDDEDDREARHFSNRTMLCPLSSSHRVASPRPVRLLPVSGGKFGQYTGGQWAKNKSFHLSKYTCLLLHRSRFGFVVGAAHQRLYYVITLRRLLC